MSIILALALFVLAFALVGGFLINHWLLLLVIIGACMVVPALRRRD